MRRFIALLVSALLLAPFTLVRSDIPHAALLPVYADAESQFVTIAGASIHYRDEGTGIPLVLVHGTGASLHTWDGWVTALRPHVRLIRMDLPGHGLSGPSPTVDYSIAAYVEVLNGLVEQLGIAQFALAGNSMGGDIAWHYALAYPDKVERLILLDPTGYPAPFPLVFQLSGMPVLGAIVSYMTPRFLADTVTRDLYGDDTRITAATYERYATLSRHEGNRAALHKLLLSWNTDDFGRIAAIQHPTLILWGEADTFQSVAYAHRFDADIADSTLIIYPGVGHVPMEELPARTAADALAFLMHDHPFQPNRAPGGRSTLLPPSSQACSCSSMSSSVRSSASFGHDIHTRRWC
jgi:pimeloyl-ACP methyl ester carboxylesterase